jgi:hypothetical protein
MLQLVQESKSLQRIRNEYTKDAVGSDDIMGLWKVMEKEKEAHIGEMQELIKKYSVPSNV